MDQDINLIERSDILDFRKSLIGTIANSTINNKIKALRRFFKDAKIEGLILENPVEGVRHLLKDGTEESAQPFTLDQLQLLLAHEAVEGTEWESMIFLGLYTAQRIGDLASLLFSNVDLQQREIKYITRKTGRVVLVPISDPLYQFLLSIINEQMKPDDPLMPELHETFWKAKGGTGGANTLSRQFGDILAKAGLRPKTKHRKIEGRKGNKRKVHPLSFKSLRHTAVSLMKNAGVSPAIVQDVVGHDSPEMSTHYTTIDYDAKRSAIDSLPDLRK